MQSTYQKQSRRPTVEELQARVARVCTVVRSQDFKVEKKESQILDQFKLGVRRGCATSILEDLKKLSGCKTQREFAYRFQISESVISRGFEEGQLSLENVVIILTEIEKEFNDMSELPPRRLRAIAGFCEAIRFLVFGKKKEDKEHSITLEEFECLRALYMEPSWFELEVAQVLDPTNTELVESFLGLTKQVVARAEEFVGRPVSFRTPDAFRLLAQRWGEAFWQCYAAVPYQWLSGQYEQPRFLSY